MGGLKNSSWQCPPRKNSAQILGCTPPLVSPDVAVRWNKSTSPPYTHGKNPMGGLKNSSWQCPTRKNSTQILGCTPPMVSPDVSVRWKKSNYCAVHKLATRWHQVTTRYPSSNSAVRFCHNNIISDDYLACTSLKSDTQNVFSLPGVVSLK